MAEDRNEFRPPFGKRLERFVSSLFGTLNYSPPSWMKKGGAASKAMAGKSWSRVSPGLNRYWALRKENPKKFWTVTGGSLAGVAVVGGGLYWYETRPKPNELTVSAENPPLTRLVEGNFKTYPAYINFAGSAAKLDLMGKVVTQGIKTSPKIEGEWRWVTDSRLSFQPQADWPIGQSYTVTIDRSILNSEIRLSTYKPTFKTEPFTATLGGAEFHQDPKIAKNKSVVATVFFSHPVNSKEFEKRIAMSMPREGLLKTSRSVPFTVSYDKHRLEGYIHSENLEVPMKDSSLTLVIDKGIRAEKGGPASEKKFSREVSIPGMYTYFRINGATLSLVRNDRYEPEQVLVVETTAGVSIEELTKHLSVYLLPVDRPASQGTKAKKKYRWNRPEEIGNEVLQLSEKVELKPIPTELEYGNVLSYRYKAPVGRYVHIKVEKGTKSYGDYILAKTFETVQRVPQFPQEVKIMAEGSLLSLSGSRKLSILSRDIDAIRFEVARVVPGQVNHLITQSSGVFSNPEFNYYFGQDHITEVFTETRPLTIAEEGKTQFTAFDFTEYLSKGSQGAKRGLFLFKAEAWDQVRNQSLGQVDKRLILVTDLGVLLKQSKDGSSELFVQSIATGKPVGDATAEVLGKNGLPVITAPTNGEGQAKFPTLKDFQREKEPIAYVVRRGSDFSFLPFQRYDRRLDFTRFDIGGEVTEVVGDRLNAYLFSDRGIYRPGDKFNIGMIVKSNDWKANTGSIPLEAVVLAPNGLEISKRKLSLSSVGFEEFSYQTQENAPTGTYSVYLYIARDKKKRALLGSTTVRVEEFLPDRMRITSRFSTERLEGWVNPKDLKANVSLKNLFGLPAMNHRVTGQISLSPTFPTFKAYKDYRFHDPAQTDKTFSEVLGSQQTNDQGEVQFTLGLERFERASYRVTFAAEGFEAEGGRSVTSHSMAVVSPLDYLIGYKTDGDLHYVNKDSQRAIQLIAIDPELKQIEVKGLSMQTLELRYVSALTKQANGTFKYQSVRKEIPLSTKPLVIPKAGMSYPLQTDQPGDFALIVQDETGAKLSRIEYSVAGHGNLTRSLEKNAELQVKLNKGDFAPGEEIELQIIAPYTGSGLITIERERVYGFKWFHTTTTSTIQKIKVPAGLEGNGYVNVSFVRAMDSQEIFMSPLSYAVAPFSISRDRRVNKVDIEVVDRGWPGEPYKIKYKTEKPGKIVVFAVDEGILQVARYKTPDPLSFFFQKRALEITTSQILDQILPEFELLKSMAAAGGGEGDDAFGKNLNPFKRKREAPVVYWSGIINSDGKPGTLTYPMPDYFNGSVKVFAVAVSSDSVGVATKSSFIRGHFVLSPNVPTFVAPNDEFTVSVAVTNDVTGSGKDAVVDLDLKTSKHLEVLDKPKSFKVGEGREETARFLIRAKDSLGSGSFVFSAKIGDKHGKYTVDLSVRPPVPKMTELKSGFLKKATVDVPISRQMYPHFRTSQIALSHLPLIFSKGLTRFLDDYPYGCTEQLVSKAFPALVLRKFPEFGYSPKKVEERLEQTISVLRARQNSEGAFGFWAANSFVSEFQTVYATHFLTEAAEMDYGVPREVLSRALSYLKLLATKDPDSLNDQRAVAYAIYVLARNGVIPTNYVASLRKKLPKDESWKKDLTGIYLAATYQILQQRDEAWKILKDVKLKEPQRVDYAYFYDDLVRDSQLLYILSKHFPDRAKALDGGDILRAFEPIGQGSYNTISSSYAILALSAYAELVTDKTFVNATLFEEGEDKKQKQLNIPAGIFPSVEYSEQAKNLKVTNKADMNLFYMLTEQGFDKGLPNKEIKGDLEIVREFQDENGKPLTEVKIGDQVEVHIKVRALKNGVPSIAIVDLLPGGFEPVLESARDTRQSEQQHQNADPEGGGPESFEGEEGFGEVEEEASLERRPPQFAGPLSFPVGLAKSTWQPNYIDIREDRVLLFGWVGNEAKEFVYRARATNQGKYVVPPAFAESMYDQNVKARSLPSQIVVKPEKE